MSSPIRNQLKIALRKQMKESLKGLTAENRNAQSKLITEKILESEAFKRSKRISVYLSLDGEVNTKEILNELFRSNKEVFVPSYSGNQMVMLKINGSDDYDTLPLTKWNIKQPNDGEGRENASETGGLDLIIMPGVAFTKDGGRMGHGMGYYDKYLSNLFVAVPSRRDDKLRKRITEKLKENKTILIGLAFKEQICENIPLDPFDILLDGVITAE